MGKAATAEWGLDLRVGGLDLEGSQRRCEARGRVHHQGVAVRLLTHHVVAHADPVKRGVGGDAQDLSDQDRQQGSRRSVAERRKKVGWGGEGELVDGCCVHGDYGFLLTW